MPGRNSSDEKTTLRLRAAASAAHARNAGHVASLTFGPTYDAGAAARCRWKATFAPAFGPACGPGRLGGSSS